MEFVENLLMWGADGFKCMVAGATTYSTEIDMWSLGCIMAEVLTNKVLFAGKGELEQINEIYNLIGAPNEDVFKGFMTKLPHIKKARACLSLFCCCCVPWR